jgi:cytochrome b561
MHGVFELSRRVVKSLRERAELPAAGDEAVKLMAPRQIWRRLLLSRDAVYQDEAVAHGTARSNLTRLLHVLLLAAVLYQLISSEFTGLPDNGEAPSLGFRLHEYIGMTSLGIVTVFWGWTLVRHGETRLSELFPWLFPGRTRAIFNDVVCQARLLSGPELVDYVSGILASAVHGLGLLVVTGMAATGTVYFFALDTPLGRDALDIHRLIANFMWAYLIGHAALAALHHLLGSDVLRRMFWIKRGRTVATLPAGAAARAVTAMRGARRRS